MKKLNFRMTTLIAAMMMTVMSFAKTQDWGGRVIDENGEPMPFVNVVLLSLPDSAFVQGGMTDEQGVFKIVTDVKEGLFKVTSVGYQTLYIKAGNDLKHALLVGHASLHECRVGQRQQYDVYKWHRFTVLIYYASAPVLSLSETHNGHHHCSYQSCHS